DELDLTAEVGDDRLAVRIPAEEEVTRLDLLAVLHHEGGTIGHRQATAYRAFPGEHDDLTFPAGHDAVGRRRLHHRDALELRLPVHLRLPLRLRRDACGGTADVEGPQRQLRTRLTDGLCGQNADRLAQVDRAHGRQVA